MKKNFCLVVLCLALLAGVNLALADDGFYVIGGGKAGTQINSVPYTINFPGLYCLAQNLTYATTTGNAITVNSSDVTLDLLGFTLTGPGKTSGSNYGISINSGINNVEIRNGTIKNFGNNGINAAYSTGSQIIGLRVTDNGASGVFMSGPNHLVFGCSLQNNSSNGAAIGPNGLLKGNHVYNNGAQGLNGADSTMISGNVCRSNVGNGIDAYFGCSVLDNLVTNSGGIGIHSGDGCTVTRNTSRGNSGVGINTGNNCLIINNTTQGLTYGGTGCNVLENVNY